VCNWDPHSIPHVAAAYYDDPIPEIRSGRGAFLPSPCYVLHFTFSSNSERFAAPSRIAIGGKRDGNMNVGSLLFWLVVYGLRGKVGGGYEV
jgi:hypothetical protein